MNAQTRPQDFLDDMHAIGIPGLFQPHISPRERAAGIRKARQELGRLRTELVQQRDGLEQRNGALSAAGLRRAVAAYNLLLLLHEQLTAEVNDLEHHLTQSKALPPGIEFGRYIFGDEQTGEWFIGSQEQFDEWGKIQQFKQRLDALRLQGQPLREQLGSIRSEFMALNEKRQETAERLEKRGRRRFVLQRIVLLVLLMIASGAVGVQYFDLDRTFSLIALGLMAACGMLIPLVLVDWKSPKNKLQSTQRKLESQMRELQSEGSQQRQRYQPLELQIKALEVHYQRMRDSWEEARLIKQRLDGFIEEGQPLRQQVSGIRSELEILQEQRQKLQRKLESRQKRGGLLRRLVLHLMLVLVSGVVGFYLQYTQQSDYAAISYGLGAFFILLVPLAYIDWKQREMTLNASLNRVETQMRQLQTEGKQVMQRYQPLELQIKTLIAQYKRKRAGLENRAQAPFGA